MSEGFPARFPLSVKSVRFPVCSWLRRSCVGLHLTPKYLRCNRTQGIKDRDFLDNLALVNKSRAVLTCQSDGPFPFLFGVLSTKKERLITSYRGFFLIGNLRLSTTVECLREPTVGRAGEVCFLSMVDWIEYEPCGAKKKEIKIVNKQAATVEWLIDGHRVKNVISWTSWSLSLRFFWWSDQWRRVNFSLTTQQTEHIMNH